MFDLDLLAETNHIAAIPNTITNTFNDSANATRHSTAFTLDRYNNVLLQITANNSRTFLTTGKIQSSIDNGATWLDFITWSSISQRPPNNYTRWPYHYVLFGNDTNANYDNIESDIGILSRNDIDFIPKASYRLSVLGQGNYTIKATRY